MKTFYKIVNKIARTLRLHKLESWSYLRWFRWWMRKDLVMGYWRFVAEYLSEGEIPTEVDA